MRFPLVLQSRISSALSLVLISLLGLAVTWGTVSWGTKVARDAESSLERDLAARQAELQAIDRHLEQRAAKQAPVEPTRPAR